MPSVSDVLGLPPGFPSPTYDSAALRYVLLALVAVWCWGFARDRPRTALLAGLACCVLSTSFWILALERPWGVLEDAEATRAAAELSVAAASGSAESFVVGVRPAAQLRLSLLSAGVPLSLLQLLPTLLPLFVLPALGLVVLWAWERREHSAFGATLVLIASTSELGAVQGWGLLTGIWSHAVTAAALPLVAGCVLLAARAPRARPLSGLAALAVLLAAVPAGAPMGGRALGLALTLDQGLWLPVGLLGLWRDRDPAALALTLGGATGAAVAVFGGPSDAWGALALMRIGLLLGAAPVLRELAVRIGTALQRPWLLRRLARSPGGLGAAVLLMAVAPAAVLVWWDPLSTDATYAASLSPPSLALEPSTAWIREHTPADAVFLTSPAYASVVAVRSGRRVLRAPEVPPPPDAARRVRAERLLLVRRPLPEWVRRYGVGWVFVAPGDFRARGVESPEELVGRPGLILRYRDHYRVHVFEVEPDP